VPTHYSVPLEEDSQRALDSWQTCCQVAEFSGRLEGNACYKLKVEIAGSRAVEGNGRRGWTIVPEEYYER